MDRQHHRKQNSVHDPESGEEFACRKHINTYFLRTISDNSGGSKYLLKVAPQLCETSKSGSVKPEKTNKVVPA